MRHPYRPARYVLLTGLAHDPVLRHYAHFIKQHQDTLPTQHPWLFLDQSELGNSIWIDRHGIHYRALDLKIEHSDIAAVYNRSVGPKVDACSPQQRQAWYNLQFYLDWHYPHVINRPRHSMSNTCKPWQLLEAQRIGWPIPVSVIAAHANLPYPRHTQWISKSISSYRTIVHAFAPQHFPAYAQEPTLLQETIAGDNWRVHVIDYQHVHAVHITTSAIDYRYASQTTLNERKLPPIIAERCRRTARHFKLRFCGIDLIAMTNPPPPKESPPLLPSNLKANHTTRPYPTYTEAWPLDQQVSATQIGSPSFYFLEANPNPGYSYFEQQTQSQTISQHLYHLLQGVQP